MQEFCPACKKNGIDKRITLVQINLEEAVWLCESSECTWPFGYQDLTYVPRKIGTGWFSEQNMPKPPIPESTSVSLTKLGLYTPPVTPGSGSGDTSLKDSVGDSCIETYSDGNYASTKVPSTKTELNVTVCNYSYGDNHVQPPESREVISSKLSARKIEQSSADGVQSQFHSIFNPIDDELLNSTNEPVSSSQLPTGSLPSDSVVSLTSENGQSDESSCIDPALTKCSKWLDNKNCEKLPRNDTGKPKLGPNIDDSEKLINGTNESKILTHGICEDDRLPFHANDAPNPVPNMDNITVSSVNIDEAPKVIESYKEIEAHRMNANPSQKFAENTNKSEKFTFNAKHDEHSTVDVEKSEKSTLNDDKTKIIFICREKRKLVPDADEAEPCSQSGKQIPCETVKAAASDKSSVKRIDNTTSIGRENVRRPSLKSIKTTHFQLKKLSRKDASSESITAPPPVVESKDNLVSTPASNDSNNLLTPKIEPVSDNEISVSNALSSSNAIPVPRIEYKIMKIDGLPPINVSYQVPQFLKADEIAPSSNICINSEANSVNINQSTTQRTSMITNSVGAETLTNIELKLESKNPDTVAHCKPIDTHAKLVTPNLNGMKNANQVNDPTSRKLRLVHKMGDPNPQKIIKMKRIISPNLDMPTPATTPGNTTNVTANVADSPLHASEKTTAAEKKMQIDPPAPIQKIKDEKPLKKSTKRSKSTKYQGFSFGMLSKKSRAEETHVGNVQSPDNASTCSDMSYISESSTSTERISETNSVLKNLASPDSGNSSSVGDDVKASPEKLSNVSLDLMLEDFLHNDSKDLSQMIDDDWLTSLIN